MNPDAYQFHRLPNTAAHQFKGHHIISDQVGQGELTVVWQELERVLSGNVSGDIVELGCYAGTTSLFIRRLLDARQQSSSRMFHTYDSFAGLPPKVRQDNSPTGTDFQAGKLSVSKKEFLQQFRSSHLQPPIVHKAWFNELTVTDIPNHIAFAFLDGDFYDSILVSLQLVWPHMSPGATIVIDDYKREALPGVEQAINDFFTGQSMPRLQTIHDMAVIRL